MNVLFIKPRFKKYIHFDIDRINQEKCNLLLFGNLIKNKIRISVDNFMKTTSTANKVRFSII